MDYGKAFSYFTDDENWAVKYLLGAVLSILPIVNFLVSGYILKIIDVMPDSKNLPEWDDWGELFKNGFFLFVTMFVYSFPMIIVITALSFSFFLPVVLAKGDFNPTSSQILLLIAGGLFVFIYMIILGIVTPAIYLIFNKTKSIAAALSIGDVLRITKDYFNKIILVVLISWGLAIAVGTIGQFPILGFIFVAAASFYQQLVAAHLYGQLDKIVYPTEPKDYTLSSG